MMYLLNPLFLNRGRQHFYSIPTGPCIRRASGQASSLNCSSTRRIWLDEGCICLDACVVTPSRGNQCMQRAVEVRMPNTAAVLQKLQMPQSWTSMHSTLQVQWKLPKSLMILAVMINFSQVRLSKFFNSTPL